MPDKSGPDDKKTEPRRFISEKIVKQPRTKREIMRRAIALLLTAALFGIVAAVTFVVSRPVAEKYFGKETTRETTPVTIPKDDPDTTAAEEPETTQATTKESEPIEDLLESAMKKYPFSIDDLNTLYGNLRAVSLKADKGIVTVHSVKTQTDWFNNPVENSGLFAGAVISSANEELLVLTPEGAVEAADSIRVAFSDGTEVQGTIRQTDKLSGMAIVSVPTAELGRALLEEVKAIELGNSYGVKQGDIVIAVGAPAGIVHSSDYGNISYVVRNVQTVDGNSRIFYTDANGDAGAGTFLLNISGELIGWVTDKYDEDGVCKMTTVVAISDYKGILERLSNGIPAPYFGIKGQEVSPAMEESGMPHGIYVTATVTDSPAYNAGIQAGDIITWMNGEQVGNMKDFQNLVEKLHSGDKIKVAILRSGKDEYKEIEFSVTIGAR